MARLSADERRAQLVDAAIRVMCRDGVAGATTRAIVAEAGVPLGVFHYCFRSKEELLQEVLETIVGRELHAALSIIGRKRSPRAAMRASLRALWEVVEKNPEEHLVTYELTQYALRQPGLAALARRQYDHYVTSNVRYFEALADVTGIRWKVPLPFVARLVATQLDGITLRWLVDRDSEQALAMLDACVDQVLSLTRPARGS